MPRAAAITLGIVMSLAGCTSRPALPLRNPHPVALRRPTTAPLSEAARIGALVFRDSTLSASGHLACATCHRPDRAYGPGADGAVVYGGIAGNAQGRRTAPSLRYALVAPEFTIGPDNDTQEIVDLHAKAVQALGAVRSTKAALVAPAAPALVPQGGLFWDGRVNTLQDQAAGPLFDPNEMANRDVASVAARLRRAAYYPRLVALFGVEAMGSPGQQVDEALFAAARYQIEDPSFHPYRSKYDAYLEGTAELTPAEARGLQVFEDTARGNCAACHLDRPARDGTPPAFTDYQYEALGVPRNPALAVNRDSSWFDLGVCGPIRTDLSAETQYCGMFRTPSLRNVALRPAFFHNGAYRTLEQAVRFYNLRAAYPDSIYPVHAGVVALYDDLPLRYHGNVDTADAPFTRRSRAPMSEQDVRDLVAFLGTLTDR